MGEYTGNTRAMQSKQAIFLVMKRHNVKVVSPFQYNFEKETLHKIVTSPFVVILGQKSDKKDSIVRYAVASKLLKIYRYGNLKIESLSVYPDMEGSVVLVDTSMADVNGKHILYMLHSHKQIILDINSEFELKELFGKNTEHIIKEGVKIDVGGDQAVKCSRKRQVSSTVSFAG